jgi:hypothetical protein
MVDGSGGKGDEGISDHTEVIVVGSRRPQTFEAADSPLEQQRRAHRRFIPDECQGRLRLRQLPAHPEPVTRGAAGVASR